MLKIIKSSKIKIDFTFIVRLSNNLTLIYWKLSRGDERKLFCERYVYEKFGVNLYKSCVIFGSNVVIVKVMYSYKNPNFFHAIVCIPWCLMEVI